MAQESWNHAQPGYSQALPPPPPSYRRAIKYHTRWAICASRPFPLCHFGKTWTTLTRHKTFYLQLLPIDSRFADTQSAKEQRRPLHKQKMTCIMINLAECVGSVHKSQNIHLVFEFAGPFGRNPPSPPSYSPPLPSRVSTNCITLIPSDMLEGAGKCGHRLRLAVRDHEQHQRLALAPVRFVRPEEAPTLQLNHVSLAHVTKTRVSQPLGLCASL